MTNRFESSNLGNSLIENNITTHGVQIKHMVNELPSHYFSASEIVKNIN